MAGDWIKMRTSLLTNPKVNGIARELENSIEVGSALSTGFVGVMSQIVTRSVMRHVTVSSLLVIWGAANEHTKNGIFENADLDDIDDMVSIPGFAAAMKSMGWLEYDSENSRVILPNFSEYNTSGASRSAISKTAAQRQKEYRERKKQERYVTSDVTRDITRDVTRDVTSNRREEKRREEIKENNKRKKHPLPKDFQITKKMVTWFEKQNFQIEINSATEKWADAMRSNESKYQYTNWEATWRGGMRKAQEWFVDKNPNPTVQHSRRMMPKPGEPIQ